MRVIVTVSGEKTASLKVGTLGARASLKPIGPQILAHLRGVSRRQFDAEGSGPHGPWKPISLSWKARKTSRGSSPRIMQETGALRRSLTTARAPGSVGRTTDTMLTYGTTIGYAKYHPDRPLIDLRPDDVNRLVQIVRDWVVRGAS